MRRVEAMVTRRGEPRAERVRAVVLASLRIERARASLAKEAKGSTADEMEAGRVAAARALLSTGIPSSELPSLGDDELALLVDAWLEHESIRPRRTTGKK